MKTKFRMSGNRTLIGIICVILALVITFAVGPLINRATDQKVDIVRVKADVARGHVFTADDIEVVNVGSHNLPSGVIKDDKQIIGKIATTNLYAGDYFLAAKITADSNRTEDVLMSLDGSKVAISVAISNLAQGMSNKLENGDIVSAIVYDKDMYTSFTPAELKYLRVITTTNNDGVDKDKDTENTKAATVTVLATPEQAELLAQYNSVTTIHFALVYRGDAEKANEFIKVQDDYLANKPASPVVNETEAEARE